MPDDIDRNGSGALDADRDFLLINPPFSIPDGPYISIPTLASYLKSKRVPISAVDLNSAFFREFLTAGNILAGYRYVTEKLRLLNDKDELTFSEMVEYHKLFRLVSGTSRNSSQVALIKTGFIDFEDIQSKDPRLVNVYLQLASAPFYPESVMKFPKFMFNSALNHFSSFDIERVDKVPALYSNILEKLVKELLESHTPKLIGFSVVFTTQILPAFYCAAIIKKLAPEVHVVMGGPSISTYLRSLEEKSLFRFVDSFVMDEGEVPLETLIGEISEGSPDLTRVPALVYLSGGEIRRNAGVKPLDLEALPPPDYTVFALDQYLDRREEMRVAFRLSRGCPWSRCTFCKTSLSMVHSHQQPPKDFVYRQLKQVIEETGIRKFMFSDESAHPEVLEYISERLLEDKIKIEWITHTRVSRLLTRERCQLFKRAGCILLSMGVESFSNRILKLMQKGITRELTEQVIEAIGGVIPLNLYMILGFPTETKEEALAGWEMVKGLKARGLIAAYEYNLFTHNYGSHIWAHPEEFGITEIHYPEKCDLSPDAYEFECGSGMSRGDVAELSLKLNPVTYKIESPGDSESIDVDGHKMRFHYDLDKIVSIIDRQLETHISDSFCRMLKQGNGSIAPMTPDQ